MISGCFTGYNITLTIFGNNHKFDQPTFCRRKPHINLWDISDRNLASINKISNIDNSGEADWYNDSTIRS